MRLLEKGEESVIGKKRSCRPKPPRNAHDWRAEAHQARVTHPFHPLHGRTLAVVDRRRAQDGEYVRSCHAYPVVVETDAQGEAVLKLDRGGLWYARLIHMVAAHGHT